MHNDSSEKFLLLYKLAKDCTPYQPTKSYTNSKTFIPDPLLSKLKHKFVPDNQFVQNDYQFVKDDNLPY